jgi:hypothetical protein
MSPTAREVIANRGLSGTELKQIIREDQERLLEAEGMLSDHLSYGRISYRLILQTFYDNPLSPRSETTIESRRASVQSVSADPRLASLDAPPPSSPVSSDAQVGGTSLTRNIDSPNAERIRAGLPIRVEIKQPDRTVSVQEVHYPPDDSLGDGDVTIADATNAARLAAGLPLIPSAAEIAADSSLSVVGRCGCTRRQVAASGLCTAHGVEWIDADSPDAPTHTDSPWPTTHDDKISRFFGGAVDSVRETARSVVRAAIGSEDPT